ncbi:hypothetical protein [Frankia sp. CiP1_Cm_nod2]|uniref:hypothetical protein n=1 Tax=Frankia sp. CiP1_Cm_nod2 TaxID=2897161 RepID=UPI0020241D6C
MVLSCRGPREVERMSLQPRGLPEIPTQTVAAARAAFPRGTLAMRLRDRLAEVFVDEPRCRYG